MVVRQCGKMLVLDRLLVKFLRSGHRQVHGECKKPGRREMSTCFWSIMIKKPVTLSPLTVRHVSLLLQGSFSSPLWRSCWIFYKSIWDGESSLMVRRWSSGGYDMYETCRGAKMRFTNISSSSPSSVVLMVLSTCPFLHQAYWWCYTSWIPWGLY